MHEQIAVRHGRPGVFRLEHYAIGLWLHVNWARPDDRWSPETRVVFSLRKIEPVKS